MMSYRFFYCKSWFWAKKKPTGLLSEEQAKLLHDNKETYTILVNDIYKPFAVIEVSNDFISVNFLDDLLRNKLSYQFEEVELRKVFLSMATYREYDGEQDGVCLGTSYVFAKGGDLIIRKQIFNPSSLEESQSTIDVSGNYESYPDFGNYNDILNIER